MSNTQDLLKKINYIEADVEIHKQILFSLPADQAAEMEKIVRIIAGKRQEIEALRQQIRASDPEEFARILILEKAVADFKQLAATRQFSTITGRNINEPCLLTLNNEDAVECLLKACDADGNWTIITLEGQIRHYPQNAVAEVPVTPPVH
jgi:hypothetical protein